MMVHAVIIVYAYDQGAQDGICQHVCTVSLQILLEASLLVIAHLCIHHYAEYNSHVPNVADRAGGIADRSVCQLFYMNVQTVIN